MILDTTYLLPLARIRVRRDLLRAIAEGRVRCRIGFGDIAVSLISVFELQAKASKLGVPPEDVARAVDVIFRAFRVIPFYRADVIVRAHELRSVLGDYIDCIIVATAVALREDLATEDSGILRVRDRIEARYGIKVFSYQDLVGGV